MSAKTTTHVLQLVAGPLRLDITEGPEAIFFAISGVKPLGFEKRKLSAFLFPLIDAYRDDERRMQVSGQHSLLTGHIKLVPGVRDWWMGYQATVGGRQ